MSRLFHTLLLAGVTFVAGGLSGCLSETGSRTGQTSDEACLGQQYFDVEWGVDSGEGTLPYSCDAVRALRVQLATNALAPYATLLVQSGLSCTTNRFCVDGSPCPLQGTTYSGVPTGTVVVSASLVDPADKVLATAINVPASQVPMPRCAPAAAAFLFGVIL